MKLKDKKINQQIQHSMKLQIKTTECHKILWPNKENQKLIISHILHQCIVAGKSRHWWWSDFTGKWYKDAQNAYNQMAWNGYVIDDYTMTWVLTNAYINFPNFELPCRDLINEYSDVYYITINDFRDGLEKMAMLHPNEYECLINYVFTDKELLAPQWENYPHYQHAFDFAFQYIVMGRQKYRKGQNNE